LPARARRRPAHGEADDECFVLSEQASAQDSVNAIMTEGAAFQRAAPARSP
jgi:hypothetical protein